MSTFPSEKQEKRAVSRRRVLAIIGASAVTGCQQNQFMPSVVETARFAWQGPSEVPLTRTQIAEMPYATMRAKFAKNSGALLVLGRYDGEDLHWISANRAVLVSRHGRLVKTVGLPKNLLATQAIGTDPVAAGLQRISGEVSAIRLIDIGPDNHFQVPIHSTYQRVQEETIDILELEFRTLHVQERSVARTLKWEFVNDFWADRHTGFIWRSIQHVAPDLPPIEMEVLKPAA